MEDYGEVAGRFSFYMTHGLEQSVPLGFGNMTWFTGANKDFVLLENSPHPDYQWFYDPTWSYTTAQIYRQRRSHLRPHVSQCRRGVIFNEMWHDYSISSMPRQRRQGQAHTNENNFSVLRGDENEVCNAPEFIVRNPRNSRKTTCRWRSGIIRGRHPTTRSR